MGAVRPRVGFPARRQRVTTRPSLGDWLSKPPLTPEYQAKLEASIADLAIGGTGQFPPTTLGRRPPAWPKHDDGIWTDGISWSRRIPPYILIGWA